MKENEVRLTAIGLKSEPNSTIAIREVFLSIQYLLKNTDENHGAKISDVQKYIEQNGFKTRHQRLSQLLDTLVSLNNETEKIGFKVDRKVFLENENDGVEHREQYYISKRAININDLQDIKLALLKDDENMLNEDVLATLQDIFVSIYDEDLYSKQWNINIKPQRGKQSIIYDRLAKARSKRLLVKIDIKKVDQVNGVKSIYGHVVKCDVAGDKSYIITLYDKETHTISQVSSNSISNVDILDTTNDYGETFDINNIDYGHVKLGNRQDLNNFMVCKVDGKPVDPNSGYNKHCCIIDNVPDRVIFKTNKIHVAESIHQIAECRVDANVNPIKVTVYLRGDDINKFINWIINPNIFFNIYDIQPKSILTLIRNYTTSIAKLLNGDLYSLSLEDEKSFVESDGELYIPKECSVIYDDAIIAEVLAEGGKQVKTHVNEILARHQFNPYVHSSTFANLNADGKTYWSNPPYVDSNDDYFYLVLNNPFAKTLYVFKLSYNKLNTNSKIVRVRNGKKMYDIQLILDKNGQFINKRSGTSYSNDLVAIIHYK